MGSIRLHREHGLNPTMSMCIICQKETGEIALLGAGYKEQAPMHMITSVEPCEACRKTFLSKGVLLVEAERSFNGHKEETKPTGDVIVLSDDAFKRILGAELPSRKIAFVEVGMLAKLRKMAVENFVTLPTLEDALAKEKNDGNV